MSIQIESVRFWVEHFKVPSTNDSIGMCCMWAHVFRQWVLAGSFQSSWTQRFLLVSWLIQDRKIQFPFSDESNSFIINPHHTVFLGHLDIPQNLTARHCGILICWTCPAKARHSEFEHLLCGITVAWRQSILTSQQPGALCHRRDEKNGGWEGWTGRISQNDSSSISAPLWELKTWNCSVLRKWGPMWVKNGTEVLSFKKVVLYKACFMFFFGQGE